MQTTVLARRALVRRFAALSVAGLFTAGCAAGGAGIAAQRREPGAITAGAFTPGRQPAANYGPDPSQKCPAGGAYGLVNDQLVGAAKRAGKPVPEQDGRLCSVAEAFLAWEPANKPREAVTTFVSHWFGLPSGAQQVLVAQMQSEDVRDIADSVVKAAGNFTLNAVQPRYGMATQSVRKGVTKIALALLDLPVEIEPIPRQMQAGQQATLRGRLLVDLTAPRVTVSDAVGRLSAPQQPPGNQFEAEVKCGDKPGRIQVEIRAERAGQSGVVASFPVGCGTALPTAVAIAPEPWPTDTGQQERKIFDLVNQERTAAGLKPLAWDDAVAQVARDISQSLKTGGGGDVRKRLDAAGIASPLVVQSAAADRSVDRVQERLSTSPTNRSNFMNPDVTNAGIGVFPTSDAQGRPLVYVTEVLVKELPPLDVADARTKLKDAVEQKRKNARAGALKSDPLLDEVAENYAKALASGGGTVSKEEGEKITAPLNAAFKSVNMISGAKQDPLDFAEEPQVVSPGKSLGVGVAQGKHPTLGRNAAYVVIMVGTPRAEGKAAKGGAARPRKR